MGTEYPRTKSPIGYPHYHGRRWIENARSHSRFSRKLASRRSTSSTSTPRAVDHPLSLTSHQATIEGRLVVESSDIDPTEVTGYQCKQCNESFKLDQKICPHCGARNPLHPANTRKQKRGKLEPPP